MTLYIQNGTIYTPNLPEPVSADLVIENGKIIEIGQKLSVSGKHSETLNAEGMRIYPGFIDAHSHLGVFGHGIGFEGDDSNELNDILTPHLRAIDSINPMDESFLAARRGGVTLVGTGPGSANALGGTFTAIKTIGKRVDEMIVRDPVAMKCAFGENPKRVYKDKSVRARMTTAARIREALFKAKEYLARKESAAEDMSKLPPYDIKHEALIPVLKRQIPLKAHAHQANDLFTALRIAREFDLDITLEHVTEGHLIAQELARENVMLAVGPTLTWASKFELRNKSWETPAVLVAAGCHVSIITDCPVIQQEYLPLCAALAIKAGLSEWEALKAITLHPAEHLGIAQRVGSIEIGKDADLVLTDDSPFELATKIHAVFIDGKSV
ncbi:MAG: amidohydrolase [Planctomycetia bacterium]|nr:amidohydrolase [Planctomycetia bacterium]